jgi:hypothetical protein
MHSQKMVLLTKFTGKSRYLWICSAAVGIDLLPETVERSAHYEGHPYGCGW